jgi:hypothetical protein
MVRLKGPAVSLTAAGALGGVLTFSHIDGTNYAKRYQRPKTGHSLELDSGRAIMQFLTVEWNQRTQAERDSWIPLAERFRLPPYQAYLKFNVPRWGEHVGPTALYPPPSGVLVGSTGGWDATVQGRTVRFQIQMAIVNNNWAVTIYSKPTAGAAAQARYLIHAIPCYASGWYYWTSRPLPPGTYYFTYGRFTRNGFRSSVFGTTLTRTIT